MEITITNTTTTSAPSPHPSPTDPDPSPFRYILSFILVSLAWGFTTPFIRRGALTYKPSAAHVSSLENPNLTFVGKKVRKGFWTVVDLLRNPRYAVPLLCNVTGSVWFFILIGSHGEFYSKVGFSVPCDGFIWENVSIKKNVVLVQYFNLVNETELSLTVPIVNSLAFLFTVLGEWFAEGKIISRGK